MQDLVKRLLIFFQKRNIQYGLSFCVLVLLFVYGYLRATRGIDLTDEGYFLSIAMRYTFGAIPFIHDEGIDAGRLFNIFISPVFLLYPEVTLLQMRCLGIIIHLAGLIALFCFLARYAPPLLVALACSIVFFVSIFIMSPTYYILSNTFSIMAMVFWLSACTSKKRRARWIFSVLGGCLFSMSVLSYLTQVILLCIPVAVVGACFFSTNRSHRFFRPSVGFIGTFGVLMGGIILLIILSGSLSGYIEGFSYITAGKMVAAQAGGERVATHYSSRTGFLLHYFLQYFFLRGLPMLGGLGLALLIVPARRKKFSAVYGILAIVITLCVYFIFPHQANQANLVMFASTLFSFSFILAMLSVLVRFFDDSKFSPDLQWNSVRHYVSIWGLFLVGVFWIFTGRSQGPAGLAPLLAVSMVELYRFVSHQAVLCDINSPRKVIWPAIIYVTMIPCILIGAHLHYNTLRREVPADRLTSQFHSPKLAGVYSTPKKVYALDTLLHYLKGRVNPKDYFLAYPSTSLLYFLTQTQPAYGDVINSDAWPMWIQEYLLSKMTGTRIPEYVVRGVISSTEDDWEYPLKLNEHSPLDRFVQSSYYLEKIIYPFEVWHRGHGPKLRLFEQRPPDFKSSFGSGEGFEARPIEELPQTLAPLVVQEIQGKFNFSRILHEDGNVLRISPAQNGEAAKELQLGYTFRKNHFELPLAPGQEVTFIVSARVTVPNTVQLFIEDVTKTVEKNNITLYKTSWDEYIVSKKIRDEATGISFGISWKPENQDEYLEVKDFRIFIENPS
jgi:hypothetical protein